MSQASASTRPVVPPEEIARRIAEYRRLGYEHRTPPVMMFYSPHQTCPWPECDTRIVGVRFNLDRQGDASHQERWLAEFWQGPGLVGPCPGCGRHVLFGYETKQAVADPRAFPNALLPDSWADKADIIPIPAKKS